MQHENIWRPASGYTTKRGKTKWRCWNESLPGGQKEHVTAGGRVWLCDSMESAARKCVELNKTKA